MQITKTIEYTKRIDGLNNILDLQSDELKKLYVITSMNPKNQEYQRQYQNIMNDLTSTLSKNFSISNNIPVNIDKMNEEMIKFKNLIEIEKDKNVKYKKTLGMVENESKASFELISDYKYIYNERYLRNWSLFLSSIIGIITISKIYKTNKVV